MTLLSRSNFHVVIPSRYGSTRLPGKPLIEIAGVPLIVRVALNARAAFGGDVPIHIATDDPRITDALGQTGIPTVMTDPDHASGTDRVAEVARKLSLSQETLIINVQGDEPLAPAEMLQSFADFCLKAEDFLMGTIVVPFDNHASVADPNLVKVILDKFDHALLFSRSPVPYNRDRSYTDWPLTDYLRHVGIYAYANETLQRLTKSAECALEKAEKLEQLRALWLGVKVNAFRWHEAPPHGVDNPDDVIRVSEILKKQGHDDKRN